MATKEKLLAVRVDLAYWFDGKKDYLAGAAGILLIGAAETSTGDSISRNSLTTHSVIQGQDSGLTTPVNEHFAS